MYRQQTFYLMLVFASSTLPVHPVRHVSQQDTKLPGQQQAATSAPWSSSEDSWNYWWSYSGVSGPAYWGLVNSDWYICDKGRRQSPIDIETRSLVYDPYLTPLRADNNLISGFLYNDGHAIVFSTQQQRISAESSKHDGNASRDFTLMADQPTSLNAAAHGLLNDVVSQEPFGGSVLTGKLSKSDDLFDRLRDSNELNGQQFEKMARSNPGGESGIASLGNDESLLDNSISSDDSSPVAATNDDGPGVSFTQAGLAYPYRFETLYLRFGSANKERGKLAGSEHLINSQAFAAELQIVAYNSALYTSYSEASSRAYGLLSISVLIDVLPTSSTSKLPSKSASSVPFTTPNLNGQLELLLSRLKEIQYRGNSVPIHNFNLSALLPETDYFITYDGSLTIPSCHESVNWIVLNKPLYITAANLDILRTISSDENSSVPTGTFIAGNIRPAQPVNGRPIRTNIRPTGDNSKRPETCQQLWTRYEYKVSRTAAI